MRYGPALLPLPVRAPATSRHRRGLTRTRGRGFSTIFPTDLSTPRRSRWTGPGRWPGGVDSGRRRRVQGEPEAGRVGEPPALVGQELEAADRVVGEQQAAVEVDPLRQRRDDRRRRDPDRGLLHAAEERPEPQVARPL